MANLTITQIEDALVTAIQNDATISAYARTIESYAGQLEQDLRTVYTLFPAIWVMFDRSTARPLTSTQMEIDVVFSLLVADQSLRGGEAPRHGATGSSTGTYTMLTHLRDLLVGNNVGLTALRPFWLVSETAILNTTTFSLYEAQYSAQYDITMV